MDIHSREGCQDLKAVIEPSMKALEEEPLGCCPNTAVVINDSKFSVGCRQVLRNRLASPSGYDATQCWYVLLPNGDTVWLHEREPCCYEERG